MNMDCKCAIIKGRISSGSQSYTSDIMSFNVSTGDFINIPNTPINNIIDTSIDNDIINHIVEDNNIINGDVIDDLLNAQPFDILNEEVVMCPLCRTESNVATEIHDIRGSSDTCTVCMDRNVEVFMGACGHACMCRECYQQVRDADN